MVVGMSMVAMKSRRVARRSRRVTMKSRRVVDESDDSHVLSCNSMSVPWCGRIRRIVGVQ